MWYVDDKKSVTNGSKSSKIFNQGFEKSILRVIVTRGKKHTFFGMNINITEGKKLRHI